jgi:hypothetical protein
LTQHPSTRASRHGELGMTVGRLTLFFLIGFVFSAWYLDAYYLGDARAYQTFYDSLYRAPVSQWEMLQNLHLGSAEPAYRYLIGPAAFNNVDRILYISIWNGLFIALICNILFRYKASIIFAVFLLSNYYVLVLLGPAERLKFAYITLLFSFSFKRPKLQLAFLASSIFFHTQAIVQFVSAAAYWVGSNLDKLLRAPLRTLMASVLLTFALGTVLYFFYEAVGQSISDKSQVYGDASAGLSEAVQWVLLLIVGLAVFSGRFAYFVGMLPMGVLTILFGNRVNVATLTFFVVLALSQGKTRHPAVLLVMAYMTIKSVPFLLDVLKYGTGY